jgi:hypothetical protein
MNYPTQRLNNTLKLECVLKERNIVFYSEVRRFENWMVKHVKNVHVHNVPAMNEAREKIRDKFCR